MDSDETAAAPTVSSHSSHVEEGRFVPGTLLGGRYRIIGLLGRGGMGEVYRATDLTLGQPVALKFLPVEAARNQAFLERFHGEVRVARQVSHPNVCRVYDIGEAEGMPFISMEYVDGEDLASLLRRIGRLPSDKAIETARKICAGLAAAHDRGVIHRDLKPANIMINKRGDAVIMDFGLAAVADQLTGMEASSGTPAYMSPEQLKGTEVTPRSDIYALGLVLYEVFTGKKPYEAKSIQQLIDLQEAIQLTSMTSVAAEIDPAVERVIRRCLAPDPAKRPASALLVAAALPGGDPLAAALAAGETPSPELVASAGKTEGLPRKYSIPCLALVLICLFLSMVLRARTEAMMQAPLDYPPDALAVKAREAAAAMGYRKPADTAFWLEHRRDLMNHLNGLPEPKKWSEWLAAETSILMRYRESPSQLLAPPYGVVTWLDPPPVEPGMVQVSLDAHGRLRGFSAVPYEGEGLPTPVAAESVFHSAGLDFATFKESTATSTPRVATDQLRAWKGSHPKLPNTGLTVDIGSWKGRITHVRIALPWDTSAAAKDTVQPVWKKAVNMLPIVLVTVGMIFALLLARRNWKLGRTDHQGAFRVATARFLLAMVAWAGTVHAVPDAFLIFAGFLSVGDWLLSAALIWVLFLALEPALRARWPHSIVTWNRLLAGRWLDPQVGSHVLIGAAAGSGLWVLAETINFLGARNSMTAGGPLSYALGVRPWISGHAAGMATALNGGLVIFFLIFCLRTLLRKEILAGLVATILMTLLSTGGFGSPDWMIKVAIYLLVNSILIFLLLRSGLVMTISMIFFLNTFNAVLLGGDWSAWFAPSGLATFAMLLGIASFAFWRSLGGRELLGDDAGVK